MMAVEAFTNPKKIEFWKQALLDYAEEIDWVLKEEEPDIDELCKITNRMRIEVKKHGNSEQDVRSGRDSRLR